MSHAPAALHIPDGFLTPAISAVGWLLAVFLVGVAIRQTRQQLAERQAPLMGLMAAFIFAAQAINFPVIAGTSGHLMGGALAAILMGPWAGTLIMTAVVIIQALVFQDGGVLVMGWNIINMAVLTVFAGYAAYRLARGLIADRLGALMAGGLLGGWLSVVIGAASTAFELAASGTSPLDLALPAMLAVYALVGIGEGMVTIAVLTFLFKTKPEVLELGQLARGGSNALLVLAGLLLALTVALFSPLASPNPDGLERFALEQGFPSQAPAPWTIFPDYSLPAASNTVIATVMATLIGTLIVFLAAMLLGWMAARGASRQA